MDEYPEVDPCEASNVAEIAVIISLIVLSVIFALTVLLATYFQAKRVQKEALITVKDPIEATYQVRLSGDTQVLDASGRQKSLSQLYDVIPPQPGALSGIQEEWEEDEDIDEEEDKARLERVRSNASSRAASGAFFDASRASAIEWGGNSAYSLQVPKRQPLSRCNSQKKIEALNRFLFLNQDIDIGEYGEESSRSGPGESGRTRLSRAEVFDFSSKVFGRSSSTDVSGVRRDSSPRSHKPFPSFTIGAKTSPSSYAKRFKPSKSIQDVSELSRSEKNSSIDFGIPGQKIQKLASIFGTTVGRAHKSRPSLSRETTPERSPSQPRSSIVLSPTPNSKEFSSSPEASTLRDRRAEKMRRRSELVSGTGPQSSEMESISSAAGLYRPNQVRRKKGTAFTPLEETDL